MNGSSHIDPQLDRFEREARHHLLQPGGPQSERARVESSEIEIWNDDTGWWGVVDLFPDRGRDQRS